MVDGLIPPGGGAATRSMEAGQSGLVAAGAIRESAAADRLNWGRDAHEGHRMAFRWRGLVAAPPRPARAGCGARGGSACGRSSAPPACSRAEVSRKKRDRGSLRGRRDDFLEAPRPPQMAVHRVSARIDSMRHGRRLASVYISASGRPGPEPGSCRGRTSRKRRAGGRRLSWPRTRRSGEGQL
jgi:hypothetical protein